MKNEYRRAYLQIVTANFHLKQLLIGTRFKIAKVIIDFAQSRSNGVVSVGKKRALRYSYCSWQCRWTFWQKRFWDNASRQALKKL